MANPNYEGKNFNIEGSRLEIFDVWGLVDSSSGNWIVSTPKSNIFGFPNEMDPSPAAHKLEEVIYQDKAAGREHLIEYVGVNPLVALQLWLEGKLTKTHFENCTEDEDDNGDYIELNDVELAGEGKKVRVYENPQYGGKKYRYATFDVEGNVV